MNPDGTFGRFACKGGAVTDHNCMCPRCLSIRERLYSMYGKYASNETDLKDRYIVWSPSATQPPKCVYDNRPEAIKVAHLMASKNRGQQFAVCKIVGSAHVTDVKYESFED